jgi:hypothetical protein
VEPEDGGFTYEAEPENSIEQQLKIPEPKLEVFNGATDSDIPFGD